MADKKYTEKQRRTMNRVKVIYAFALVLAVGTALMAKYATEKSLGNIGGPLESEYLNINDGTTSKDFGKISDETVQNPVFDVPDTRRATPQTTEESTKSPYAEPYESYYNLPLGTKIINEYNDKAVVYNETLGEWRTHPAVDFGAVDGSAVVSIAYGIIAGVYDDAMYGTTVIIDHGNGVTAKYCGLNKDTLMVKEGEIVKAETALGYLGTVPCESASGAHLHFEITLNSESVEPLELMGK